MLKDITWTRRARRLRPWTAGFTLASAAVIGVPDDIRDEAVMAFVVPAPGAMPSRGSGDKALQ